MHPILVEGPAVEPVSVAEMRAYLRLHDDDGTEDALLAALVAAARLAIEAAAGRVLIESRWRLVLRAWPAGPGFALPLSPVIAVESVLLRDRDGIATDVAPALYRLEGGCDPPRLVLEPTVPAPPALGTIEILLRAGYGADAAAVPAPLRQAVRALVAHHFENRGDGAAAPPDIAALVAPYRRPRL